MHTPTASRLAAFAATLLCAQVSVVGAFADNNSLPEIVVTADFREASPSDIPTSVSVIGERTIEQRSAQHLEELLNLAPNVNFASGASRARFYQIRGIGERSQFVEPLNPSVGVLIDDIDFSGMGTAGTLLDVEQVEIFRGPQGTRYGANALAGLINMKTADPSETPEAMIETSIAEYNTYRLGVVASGPLADTLLYRVAVQQYRSDGYIQNDFLNRDNTNNRDEQTVRGKLRWLVDDELTIDLTGIYVDIDNGYDAFSLDNTRHTLSDQPGHDRQESTALGLKAVYSGAAAFTTEILTSVSSSNLEYGYDEDWSFSGLCAGTPCDGWEYSSTDNYIRDRENRSAEVRLISKAGAEIFGGTSGWVVGAYLLTQDEELKREYTFATNDFFSTYDTDKYSVFTQLETQLSDRWLLTTGYRYERHSGDYRDSDSVDFDLAEHLWGGRLALEYLVNEDTMVYGLISRGYKTGGVNSRSELDVSLRDYDTEFMTNYEIGVKSSLLNNSLQTQIALFYQKRKDVQVKQSIVIPFSDNTSPQFIDYLDNAAEGINYGLEAELLWQPTADWQLNASLGLLETELQDFVNADDVDLDGREQAHAPKYQFSLSAQYRFAERWTARLELEGKDEFFFSDRHEEQSVPYETWNTRIAYGVDDWEVALWGRNLLDKDYYVRGFGSFGNDPRNFYATEPYYQFGAPRVIGVSAKLQF